MLAERSWHIGSEEDDCKVPRNIFEVSAGRVASDSKMVWEPLKLYECNGESSNKRAIGDVL